MKKDLLLGLMVGGSMLVITGIYGLTFRYQQDINTVMPEDLPRWSVLTEGIITRTGPLKAAYADVKEKLMNVAKARDTQVTAITNLKAKLESATATSAAAEAPADKP